jgi:hypothetical protein
MAFYIRKGFNFGRFDSISEIWARDVFRHQGSPHRIGAARAYSRRTRGFYYKKSLGH